MVTLAAAIEIVEQLPIDQQDLLVQIIRQRQIERQRDEIVFKKISPNVLTWEDLSQRVETAGEDPEQPSLAEISAIVKQVRSSHQLQPQVTFSLDEALSSLRKMAEQQSPCDAVKLAQEVREDLVHRGIA